MSIHHEANIARRGDVAILPEKPASCACPYCGKPLDGQDAALAALRLPLKMRAVLDALRAAGGSLLPLERIEFAVWGDDINGGPDDSAGCVHAYVAKLRIKLRPLGFGIENRRNQGYRLVRSEAIQ